MNDINQRPLVSVTVITYNSSEFVLETLESIKAQTYSFIELIISDDCSSDNTVDLCDEWIKKNKERFAETHLVTSSVNTGISANKNRAIDKCSGEWIKSVAGDDALVPNVIENYIDYVAENRDIKVIHSNPIIYEENFDKESLKERKDCSSLRINASDITVQEQLQILLRSGQIYTATAMVHKSVYEVAGCYDERAPFWEDTPFWIKVVQHGIKIHYYNIFGGKYRVRSKSVQRTSDTIISKYLISKTSYKYHVLRELYTPSEKVAIVQRYWIQKLLLGFGNRRYFAMRVLWVLSGRISRILNNKEIVT